MVIVFDTEQQAIDRCSELWNLHKGMFDANTKFYSEPLEREGKFYVQIFAEHKKPTDVESELPVEPLFINTIEI